MSRLSAARRGYDARWRIRSKHFIAQHPLCAMCQAAGRVTLAVCVDHIVPHKGDRQLFHDSNNWQSLCDHCHSSRKQRAERIGYDPLPGVDGLPTDPRHPFFRKPGNK